ncbi:MAG: hypothetical protein M3355_01735 [Actinomycetota bacterium]|nr:hypothetical protein [Actinomycetota bacterium]
MTKGPLPLSFHAALELPVALVFVVAPFILGFDDDTAKTLSIVVGIAVVGLFATTAWRPAPLKIVPVVGHAVADFAVGALLVVAPFLFDFDADSTATVFFIVMGAILIVVTAATRFDPNDPFAARTDAVRH